MRKAVLLLITFLLLIIPTAVIREEARFVSRLSLEEQIDVLRPNINNFQCNNILKGFVFSPEDIELEDDAFQDSNSFHFAEWWYFDAILNEGYSIQICIYVFGFMEYRFVLAGLNIYKNGVPEATEEKIYFMDDFYISTDIPLVVLDGKQVIKGYIDQTTGDWIYDVSLEIGDSSVDLQFIGCAKGWKGRINIGGWAVILPKANVSGTVGGNGIETEVVGIGYHDHNWDMTLMSCLNFGWYWGRIFSDNASIVWFVIMKTRFSGELLLVVNKEKDCYINIEPENIHFMPEDYRIKDRRVVPHSFVIMADSQNVSLLVNLTSIELHHGRTLGVRQYWRYHLKSQGSITVDSQIENINGIEIAEFKRFR